MHFFAENVPLPDFNKSKITSWIKNIITEESKKPGEISFIYTTDQDLLNLNTSFLGRDNYTDVITFDYCDGNIISGDIFISIDRVRENAIAFDEPFMRELCRVMSHGILHLLGYKDKTKKESEIMRSRENTCLTCLYL
ncbi:MAG: rRNA maturation RNase YbeY [Bacteroidota bacterium]